MKDYTWAARETTRHLDAGGKVKSTDSEKWETVILFGKPYRKTIERNDVPVAAERRRKDQEKRDQGSREPGTRRLPQQRETRLAAYPSTNAPRTVNSCENCLTLSTFTLTAKQSSMGVTPGSSRRLRSPAITRNMATPRRSAKSEGRLWIDKAEFQWVRIEAKTTDTIS